MRPQGITKTIDMGDGKVITIETGVLAKQADGAVTVRLGDTILLATVVATKEAREGIDFLPLQVEYREKFSAAGRFPGGFFKREARPSDHEVTLAWVDHEHWSGGRFPPSTVVERLFGVLLEQRLDIPERFDAATARRWFRELDEELMRRL